MRRGCSLKIAFSLGNFSSRVKTLEKCTVSKCFWDMIFRKDVVYNSGCQHDMLQRPKK